MKGRFHFKTTFQKLTFAFFICGMLPLLIFGLIFLGRMRGVMWRNAVDNYTQVTAGFAGRVNDLIDSVDGALEVLYDYENARGENLTEILKDDSLTGAQKEYEVTKVLEQCMSRSAYISSLRFADQHNAIYSLYYDQRKTLRSSAKKYTTFDKGGIKDARLQKLLILHTMPEKQICANSQDYIFGLTRYYMDMTNIHTAVSSPLGKIYADVNIEQIINLVEKSNLENSRIYIYDPSRKDYLFVNGKSDYGTDENSLSDYDIHLNRQSGYYKVRDGELFYSRIGDTNEYAVLILGRAQIYGGLYQGGLIMILILLFFCFVLLLMYMWFSNSLANPMVVLKEGMEKLKQGNLDARVQLHTHDEMEYIADGFNDMADELQEYINQVYVAEIITKETELNALKMQIQPHYLYNTLDVIRMTALKNHDPQTAELLESLAVTLRYVMGKHDDKIHLSEELDMLKEYFLIMRVRYQNRIQLRIQVPPEHQKLLIPKLLLQPVVENAIKHGLKNKKGSGIVEISSRVQGEDLYLTVMDDGVGMTQEQVDHMTDVLEHSKPGTRDAKGMVSVGTKNVFDRIRLLYGEKYGFTINSFVGMGTIITFHLPVEKEPVKKEKEENEKEEK